MCRLSKKPCYHTADGTKMVVEIIRNDRFEGAHIALFCKSFVYIDINYLLITFFFSVDFLLHIEYRTDIALSISIIYCRGK